MGYREKLMVHCVYSNQRRIGFLLLTSKTNDAIRRIETRRRVPWVPSQAPMSKQCHNTNDTGQSRTQTYRLNDCRVGECRRWWWVVHDQVLDVAGTENDKLENVITWRHRSFNGTILRTKGTNCRGEEKGRKADVSDR